MKLIAEKKVNSVVAGIALYLSFCAANFYFARGNWAYTLSRMAGLYQTAFISNPFIAFFAGGAVSYIFYELATLFLFKSMRFKVGFAVEDMKYELRFFYFAANCTAALLSLFYLISPIVSIYGGVIFPFVATSAFGVWYLTYTCKRHVDKGLWNVVLVRLGGGYIAVYAFITVLRILGVA